MDGEDQLGVEAVFLVVASFFRYEERPVGGGFGGVVDGDVFQLGDCGKG